MSEKPDNIPEYAHSPDEALARKRFKNRRNIQNFFRVVILLMIISIVAYFIWPSKILQLSDTDAQQLASMLSPNLGTPDKMIFLYSRHDHEPDPVIRKIVIYCEYEASPDPGQSDPMKLEECKDWVNHQISLFNVGSANKDPFSVPNDACVGATAKAGNLTGACAVSGNHAWFTFNWKPAANNPFEFLEKYPAQYARLSIKPPDYDIFRADYQAPH
jgi:hypothetical protein